MTRATVEQGNRSHPNGLIAAAALPGTAQLLTDGGDARIELDPVTGLNKYGCAPLPDAGMVALGSSTASIISERSFVAAESLRTRLLASETHSDYAAYSAEMNRTRRELLSLCGISEGAGVDVVFAASGTDIHLIAAQAFSSGEKLQPLVIMVEANETGSGVAAALAGRHFSSHSALGESVTSGANIGHAAAIEVVSVALRDANGTARSDAAIDADFVALASHAAEAGRRVLLILIDGSKTGTIAPTADCVLQLQQRYADRIDVMVDACQFRIAPQTLRAYLLQIRHRPDLLRRPDGAAAVRAPHAPPSDSAGATRLFFARRLAVRLGNRYRTRSGCQLRPALALGSGHGGIPRLPHPLRRTDRRLPARFRPCGTR